MTSKPRPPSAEGQLSVHLWFAIHSDTSLVAFLDKQSYYNVEISRIRRPNFTIRIAVWSKDPLNTSS